MARTNGKKLVDKAKLETECIYQKELREHQRRGSHITILDVRAEHDWHEGHIHDAVHIPRGKLELEVEKLVPNLHTPIVVCCQHGKQAALAATTLRKMGYTDLRYLEGGYKKYCENDPD